MKRPATKRERVERARPDAAIALENIADASWSVETRNQLLRSDHVEALVSLALQDYRFRYPSCPARSSWLFYDGNPKTARIRGVPERVDVFCTFCRVLLVGAAVWDHDYTYRLAPHTTICALRSLAGQITPGAPGTYRLPSSLDGEEGSP